MTCRGMIETMNATAELKGDIWHIYSGNQFATRSGAIAAGAAGVDPKFVVMHQMWLGGGFGRRLDADMMVPAVQAAESGGQTGQGGYHPRKHQDNGFFAAPDFPKGQAGSGTAGEAL